MAPLAKQMNLTTPEWDALKKGWDGPTNFLLSHGLKPYEYEDIEEGEQIIREMVKNDARVWNSVFCPRFASIAVSL